MKIVTEQSIAQFDAWCWAKSTKQTIVDNDKEEEFDELINGLYPDGIDETKLNDILLVYRDWETDRKSTRLNSSHSAKSRMPSSA